jgi:hypothetical protein
MAQRLAPAAVFSLYGRGISLPIPECSCRSERERRISAALDRTAERCYPPLLPSPEIRMRSWLHLVAVALVSGCTTVAPPDRLVFGVSGARPAGTETAEADTQMRAFLDHKVNQICTLGYTTLGAKTIAAEEDMQIVEEELRCAQYSVSLF